MTITGLAQVTAEWIGRKAFPFLRMHANGVISLRVKVPFMYLQPVAYMWLLVKRDSFTPGKLPVLGGTFTRHTPTIRLRS